MCMASKSFDHKRIYKTDAHKKVMSSKSTMDYASFVSPRTEQIKNLISLVPLTSIHNEHKVLIEEAIHYNHDSAFLSQILNFVINLEDAFQVNDILTAVNKVNKTIISEFFHMYTTSKNFASFVEQPSFLVFLEHVNKNELIHFNNCLNETLLLASTELNKGNSLFDATLEATQLLVKTNHIHKDLLYTAILAEYDLGEMHDKAQFLFDEYTNLDIEQTLHQM
jgi:hypothetical protein